MASTPEAKPSVRAFAAKNRGSPQGSQCFLARFVVDAVLVGGKWGAGGSAATLLLRC